MEVIKTDDGSFTFFSEKFKEPYHSLTAGAFKEAIEKFCKPCKISEKAKRGSVNLFDVCFGLGYNTTAFLETAFSSNTKVKIFIVGFEIDISVIEKSLRVSWSKYERWKNIIRTALKNKKFDNGFLTLNYFSPQIKLKIYIGEGREVIKRIYRKYERFADAIFHDPFSPRVNPELWTLDFFKKLRNIIKEDGVFATYSAASPIRKALWMSGFGVKEGVAIGRKSKSTIASPSFKTEKKLLEKFLTSINSTPYRDPNLKDHPSLIKSRREGCIWLQKKLHPVASIY
ncbi:tRNA (5-methylaminomethyl-2-thiouridine)(34)-methyltransferase MnmD [Desulfurobacterium thermolithotrophum]|uniref:tRNA (5-methylaminomethyl-2-thiouridine)(34)-methyltransferase MnmD n=1 Tax=Desulfurobacterium thermolithotrophum TaxID=64160 RepID=UPI0013CFAF67|nr:MnmC family methyltransferase [Desulfurobacterium thermolithotrophum]